MNRGKVVVDRLSVTFDTRQGPVEAVRAVDLVLESRGRTALLGESGCGKSVLALAMLQLLPRNARITGSVRVTDDNDDFVIGTNAVRRIRGNVIALCWSNAERFFNPLTPVGRQIVEAYTIHHPGQIVEGRERTMNVLHRLGFTDPARVFASYPFQLSGGMNQRAMIAMSIINDPAVLIVDEPTRGLDDANRELVMNTLNILDDMSLLLITHDVEYALGCCGTAHIMRDGAIVDAGPVGEVLVNPSHPYTERLVRSCPRFWEGKGLPDGDISHVSAIDGGDRVDA